MWFNNILGLLSRLKGVLLSETTPPTTGLAQGGIFVSDGTSPLAPNAGDLYYRAPLSGTVTDLLTAPALNGGTISFFVGPGVGTTDSVTSIPANSLITQVTVDVDTVFSSIATLEIGNTVTAALLASTADFDLTAIDIYEPTVQNGAGPIWSINSVVRATRAGASVGGSARVTVSYVSVPQP